MKKIVHVPEELWGLAWRTLGWYGDAANWKDDDWNCLSVIAPPDYGNGGNKAREALVKLAKFESARAKQQGGKG